MAARAIDHLVLPVSNLKTARARYEALGFTVASDARHPFGTENACIFFADGTYLEPLAVGDADRARETAREGNQFAARNEAYRFRIGQEGFSAVALKSEDAAADHAFWQENGLAPGEMLVFSRPMTLPDGSVGEATFRLAFARDLRAPDFHFFSCQRLNAPAGDRTALETHANGVHGLCQVILSEKTPTDFSAYQAAVLGAAPTEDGESLRFALENAEVICVPPAGLEALGLSTSDLGGRGLLAIAAAFRLQNLAAMADRLQRQGIAFIDQTDRLVVPTAPGQGVPFVFTEE